MMRVGAILAKHGFLGQLIRVSYPSNEDVPALDPIDVPFAPVELCERDPAFTGLEHATPDIGRISPDRVATRARKTARSPIQRIPATLRRNTPVVQAVVLTAALVLRAWSAISPSPPDEQPHAAFS